MATLMGVLAGMSRLSSDSEIVAFRTMGISNRQMLKPVHAVFARHLAGFFLADHVPGPGSQLSVSTSCTPGWSLSQTISGIKPGVFYQDLPFYSLYFRDQDRGGEWRDVFL